MSPHEITYLVTTYGYLAILIGVTVDSFGVPVPGELMLLSASAYAGATHRLVIALVAVAAVLGGILGDNFSYVLGRQGGYRLLRRYGRFIRIDHRRRRLARFLYRRYGAPVVVTGRFVPVVHIWTAFLAGTNSMAWPRFILLDAVGCVLWAGALSVAGYLFGSTALRLGSLLAELSIPIAALIGISALLAFRLAERRLHEHAERSAYEDRNRS